MFCNEVCTHGGVCDLNKGHEGKHSAGGYCEWEGYSGVSQEEGADMMRLKFAAQGYSNDVAELIIGFTTD
jgi:hypothetical protein